MGAVCPPATGTANGAPEIKRETKDTGPRSSEKRKKQRKEDSRQDLHVEPEPMFEQVSSDPPLGVEHEPPMVQASEPMAYVPPVENHSQNESGWACKQCTFLNSEFAEVCGACDQPRFEGHAGILPPEHFVDPPMITVTEPVATEEDAFTTRSAGGDPYLEHHRHEATNSHLLAVPGSRSHSRQPSASHYQDADGDYGRQASHVSHAARSDRTGPQYQDADADLDCQASHVSNIQSDWTGPRYQQEPIAAHSRQPSHTSRWGAGQSVRGSPAASRPHSRQASSMHASHHGEDLGTTRDVQHSRLTSHRSAHSELPVTQLRLKVIRAHDLKNTDLGLLPGDVSDPFVVARVGSQEFKTSVISNNLNPVWNSPHFEFEIMEEDEKLHLEVFNSNQWHADDSLGFIEVLVQNLEPNKVHKIVTRLNEGNEVRKDRKQARLEVEVQRVDSKAPPHVEAARPAGAAHSQQLALRPAKPGMRVPLPSFHSIGPEALQRPQQQLALKNGVPEYGASANRLSQYDYSQNPKYVPKEELTDKRAWKDDPFHGWRSETEPQPGPRLRAIGGFPGQRPGGARVSEKWLKDPFSGWLQKDNVMCVVDENHPELQRAQEDRKLRSLPSFRDVDVKRFDDNREYSRLHTAERRMRWTEDPREEQQPPEKVWQEDAFYGWLPGRGPNGVHLNDIPRPMEKARLNRLPSFSGDQEMLGLTGYGIGILRISIIGATDLKYLQAGRNGKPSACVHFQMVNQDSSSRTEVTATIPHNRNPRWNKPMVPFEVMTAHDEIHFKVLDLEGPEEEHLGEAQVPVQSLFETLQQLSPSEAAMPRKFSAPLGMPSQKIEFELIYERYRGQAPVPRMLTNGTTTGPGALSSKIGTLSVRVIAAFNLVNTDTGVFGDVSDPFVELWLSSQSKKGSQKTPTINNDLNPVWNTSEFHFPLTMEDDALHLEVYDEDMITSNDFLGRLVIPLYNIVHGEPNEAVRIRDQLQDIQHGELEVEVGFTPE